MNAMTKRVLTGLLAAAMAVGTLLTAVACAENSEDTNETKATGTNSPEAETLAAYDSINKTNYDRTFAMQVLDDKAQEFLVEEERITGDILEDGIYERNKTVEEDFGISIEVYKVEGYDNLNKQLGNMVMAGDDDYDAYMGHKYSFNACAQQNYLYDMNEIGTMDLAKEYWDQACRENLVLTGKNFMMTGDINPGSMLVSSCLVFNKDMLEEMKIEEPYSLVDNGGWTLDAFASMLADVSMDLNNDNRMDENDKYGLTAWTMDASYSLFYGAGGMFVDFDEDGLPVLSYDTEKVINIYDALYGIVVGAESWYVTDVGKYETTYDIFCEDRALFCDITLMKISDFLDEMDTDYGIVPMPKYDEYQEEYLSFVNGATPLMMIAQTEKDPEFVGTILEAMAAYNYDNLTPKMFEIVTKSQASRDPESAQMVDYIIRNRIYDFGYFADLSVTNLIREQLVKKSASISSDLRSVHGASKTALDQLILKWEKLQNS